MAVWKIKPYGVRNDSYSIYSDNVNFVMDNISAKVKEKLIVRDASHHLFYESKDKKTIFEAINSIFACPFL